MKKLIFVLCVGVFLGACATTSNVGADNIELGENPSLYKIHQRAKKVVAELQEKEKQNTLTDDEKELVEKFKNLDKEKDAEMLIKYSNRSVTPVDILTMYGGIQAGYSDKEISDFLKLGWYVKNPYCESEFKSYKVFQVLNDAVLVHGCEVESYDDCAFVYGKIFLIPKQSNELYFDTKILTPEYDYCSTYVGVYQYENKEKNINTVPILMFLPKKIHKAQLENIEEMREESQKMLGK